MSYEFLQTLWFILIAILWIGFFFLEGFDFGVGMLLPFLGKKDEERRAVINAIGPTWDGNEVWMLTAGGATFAAFPHWYATMFSGFYLALFLLLVGLILRGISFEYRSKDSNPAWRSRFDWMIAVGSFMASLLLGAAFANLARGVPIDENMMYTGNLFTLLNPYGLLGGLTTVVVFLLHGANFLGLKLEGELRERAIAFSKKLYIAAVVVATLLLAATYIYTDIRSKLGIDPGITPIASFVALLVTIYFINRRMEGWAFVMTALHIVLTQVTFFTLMFPRVMVSSLNPDWSLTIYNASSSQYTLTVMSVVALIFVPIVLAYQGWTYYMFRKRVSADKKTLVY
ncbi:MAG: cytochrome c oxidase assembly protein [Anaerolineaceae bacterium]|mgnify:FL=1|nr:cytochrome d ubiquinol oxidase subunit II [Anaerolineae bacterium]MBL1172422.1 cytochrome d ubiquinol oxidase subunit II [Chloroflexota bacterium]MDL1925021.1 cytochrome d ubiquinol oxidase subunit II [Anaerolineae bacterium AMX1]WKZ53438.1 MAG: cytochrome d ubiquinol oxidase subunit II [Anaerolineales bacterium]GJQ38992.1 MAG: cytochrome c oxidase assembly protein [Anaerolineaceae bacterium]